MIRSWFNHISFAYPWVLPLLLVIPFLIFWYVKKNKYQTSSVGISTTHFLVNTTNWKTRLRHLPFVLRWLSLAAFIIALARPQQNFTEQITDGEAIDIVLCMDISGSMTERDFQPNRLEASKEVAINFVQQRKGDRIGVVIFTNLSFTLCPITTDHNTVLAQINNIHSGYLQEEGTAIGSGLATSVDRLKDSKAKNKIIVLLTDGVDFGGTIPPDIAKEMAKTYNIKVYTVGVGSNKEMDIQVQDEFGTTTQRKKMEFNEALLQEIANETGGQYFHATDKENLEKVYASINQLEKSKIQVTTFNKVSDKYFWYLVTGIVLLVLELILKLTVFKKLP
ncbi:MAG: VWA domain-containing protein [Chitinophagaceae bacterium]